MTGADPVAPARTLEAASAAPAVALLLAAGFGRRFGSDKLLAPLADGTPLAVAAARPLLASGHRVVAVLRPEQEPLAALLAAAGSEVVTSATARRGMGASLSAGVAATAAARGWVVALADMPGVAAATVAAVFAALAAGASLAAPYWQGRRGHPVGFAASWKDALLGLDGDRGAAALLQEQAALIHPIASRDDGCLRDVDTRDDLRGAVPGAAPGS